MMWIGSNRAWTSTRLSGGRILLQRDRGGWPRRSGRARRSKCPARALTGRRAMSDAGYAGNATHSCRGVDKLQYFRKPRRHMANDGTVAAHAPADPEFGTGGCQSPYFLGRLSVCLSDYTGPRDSLGRTDVAPSSRSLAIAETSAASASEVSVPTDSPLCLSVILDGCTQR